MILQVLLNNIFPLLALIGAGYILGRNFKLDVPTLSKVMFYVFVPATIFTKVYEAKLDAGLFKVALFAALMIFGLKIIAMVAARIKGYNSSKSSALQNLLMFYNSGNYALPLVTLMYANTPYAAYAVAVQVTVVLIQNPAMFTLGCYQLTRGRMDFRQSVRLFLRLPTLYVVMLVLVARLIPVNLKDTFLWAPISYAGAGFVPLALVALGIQLAMTKVNIRNTEIYLAAFLRLCIGPVLGYCLIRLMGIEGVMAQVLMISSSAPSAVNAAMISVEYNHEVEYTTQAVAASTLFSLITVPAVILIIPYIV